MLYRDAQDPSAIGQDSDVEKLFSQHEFVRVPTLRISHDCMAQ